MRIQRFFCIIWVALGVLPAFATTLSERVASYNLTKEQLIEFGEFIYNTPGVNTCLKCHGAGGHGGDQAGAADLRHPRTWRSYQALGGDQAFQADKDAFLKDLETVVQYLINQGATTWNRRFMKAHQNIDMDWARVEGADQYDSMMKGTTTGPMKQRIRALQKRLENMGIKTSFKDAQAIATVAVYTYIQTFDDRSEKGGVFQSADPGGSGAG